MRKSTPPRRLPAFVTLSVLIAMGVISAASTSATPPLEEAPSPIYWERASVKLGAYFATFNSDLGFAVGRGRNVLLSGEDTLGLPSTLTAFRGDALYRPGKDRRHQLDFSYASYRRNGETTLTDPIDLGGGIVIPASRIDSVLNFDMIRLSYSYAFVQTDSVRIGGGLSAYVLPIEYGLNVAAGNTPPPLKVRDLVVPVPALALRADFRLWRRLYLTTEFNGIYLELLGFQGSILDASVGMEYRVWNHLALGVGYNGTLVDVQSTETGADYPGIGSLGEVSVNFHGVLAFVKLTF